MAVHTIYTSRVMYRLVIIFLLVFQATCIEKTLRKIVRNQSKMVQRPFSDPEGTDNIWYNSTHHVQGNVFHKVQRPRISTIFSGMENARNKWPFSKKFEDFSSRDLRQARGTFSNVTVSMQSTTENILFSNAFSADSNDTERKKIISDALYQLSSNFFGPVGESQQNVDMKTDKDNTIVIPESEEIRGNNNTSIIKGIYKAPTVTATHDTSPLIPLDLDIEPDKTDFIIDHSAIADSRSSYSYNMTVKPFQCNILFEPNAAINAQRKFCDIDIEPTWMSNKKYWNNIYDSRYVSLMRNPKWPPLKVILIPRTHVDTIWKRSFQQYHTIAGRILSNIVKKLQYYNNLTFTWNEVSHLSQWWKTTSQKSRLAFRRLVKSGRLEITTGAFVETDEATSHLFGLIHQFIEGHQWLKEHLNYSPKVAWLTNSVTHSPTMAYLLAATGITNLVLTNVHYAWEQYLAEYQYSDFIWLQNWESDKSITHLNTALNKIGNDRYPKHSVFTHYLQFNAAGFRACGPNSGICVTDFNFAKINKNIDINPYNVKQKSEILLEQYSKTGTVTPHNVILAPVGGPYRYESQSEFDYQYNNYQKIAAFVNVNREIYKATVEFGTPKDYFESVFKVHKSYPTLKGDFLVYADLLSGQPAYWTGYFTSRPTLKILLRRLHSTLRTTEILFSFAVGSNAFKVANVTSIFNILVKARETIARLQDRHVVSGTLPVNSLKYVHKEILTTVKDCWYIQEIAVSLLSTKPEQNKPYLQKYVYREGEFISVFKSIAPGDNVYIFNSMSQERTEIVELITRYPNIRIIDHNKKDVTIQLNPVWKYNGDNTVTISRRFYKVVFAIIVPPMTLELFKIKETYDASHNAANLFCVSCVVDDMTSNLSLFPFNIQPIESGDIQLESYKYRLVFDEYTGFLKTIFEKESNQEKFIVLEYGAFKSSDINSGMFLFKSNNSKPIQDILMPFRMGTKSKIFLITSGQIQTELTCVYGRLLQHTVKIINLLNSPLASAIYVESKVDYEASPKNRETELFLSIQSDIANGNPPEIFIDNNGFQYTPRILNISRRIESNLYPFTSMAFIQDHKSRLTVITDHAQGVTALQEGQLVVMLDRRVLFNDGRGTNEGLADSSVTCHRHYILLENFVGPSHLYGGTAESNVNLPSLSALYLTDTLNYVLDIFIVYRNQSNLCYYAFLPLMKTAFPCDVSVINYRVISNNKKSDSGFGAALMVLHRHGISCKIDRAAHLRCNGDPNFSLDKILRNVKAVYLTNLGGTDKGIPINNFNIVNFPAMELVTLRLYF